MQPRTRATCLLVLALLCCARCSQLAEGDAAALAGVRRSGFEGTHPSTIPPSSLRSLSHWLGPLSTHDHQAPAAQPTTPPSSARSLSHWLGPESNDHEGPAAPPNPAWQGLDQTTTATQVVSGAVMATMAAGLLVTGINGMLGGMMSAGGGMDLGVMAGLQSSGMDLTTLAHHSQLFGSFGQPLTRLDIDKVDSYGTFFSFARNLGWIAFERFSPTHCKTSGLPQTACFWQLGASRVVVVGVLLAGLFLLHLLLVKVWECACRRGLSLPVFLIMPAFEFAALGLVAMPLAQAATILLVNPHLPSRALGAAVVLLGLGYAAAICLSLLLVLRQRQAGVQYVVLAQGRGEKGRDGVGQDGMGAVGGESEKQGGEAQGGPGGGSADGNPYQVPSRSGGIRRYPTAQQSPQGGCCGRLFSLIQRQWHGAWRVDVVPSQEAQLRRQYLQQGCCGFYPRAWQLVAGRPIPAAALEVNDRLSLLFFDYRGDLGVAVVWEGVRLLWRVLLGICASLIFVGVSYKLVAIILIALQGTYTLLLLAVQPYRNKWLGLFEFLANMAQLAMYVVCALLVIVAGFHPGHSILTWMQLVVLALALLSTLIRVADNIASAEQAFYIMRRPAWLRRLHLSLCCCFPCMKTRLQRMDALADEAERRGSFRGQGRASLAEQADVEGAGGPAPYYTGPSSAPPPHEPAFSRHTPITPPSPPPLSRDSPGPTDALLISPDPAGPPYLSCHSPSPFPPFPTHSSKLQSQPHTPTNSHPPTNNPPNSQSPSHGGFTPKTPSTHDVPTLGPSTPTHLPLSPFAVHAPRAAASVVSGGETAWSETEWSSTEDNMSQLLPASRMTHISKAAHVTKLTHANMASRAVVSPPPQMTAAMSGIMSQGPGGAVLRVSPMPTQRQSSPLPSRLGDVLGTHETALNPRRQGFPTQGWRSQGLPTFKGLPTQQGLPTHQGLPAQGQSAHWSSALPVERQSAVDQKSTHIQGLVEQMVIVSDRPRSPYPSTPSPTRPQVTPSHPSQGGYSSSYTTGRSNPGPPPSMDSFKPDLIHTHDVAVTAAAPSLTSSTSFADTTMSEAARAAQRTAAGLYRSISHNHGDHLLDYIPDGGSSCGEDAMALGRAVDLGRVPSLMWATSSQEISVGGGLREL